MYEGKINILLMVLEQYYLVNAQEYNLFDPADVDANGWIGLTHKRRQISTSYQQIMRWR